LIARRVALRYLHNYVLPGSNRDPSKAAISSFLLHQDRTLPGIENDYAWNRHPTNEIWDKAREALMVDASAPLPEK
jgi:hypothetical protein